LTLVPARRTPDFGAPSGTPIAELSLAGASQQSGSRGGSCRPLEFIMKLFRTIAAAAGLLLAFAEAQAAQTNVAVAANFTDAAKEIAALFKQKTGHEAVLSFGASGQFYTQITQGAPFQVFLSADDSRPRKLVEDGLAAADSRFTYAIGKLVLWSKSSGAVTGEETLKAASFTKLSICNPAAAPYGLAAVETMKSLKLYDALKPKLVEGATITQAYQFVETGNAEVGFVALSQLTGSDVGSRWVVPQAFYSPIRQDAVLLKTGAENEAAGAFIGFLRGPEARAIIEKYGYVLDGQS
jgi:molybdate transport system substrate-binding protein